MFTAHKRARTALLPLAENLFADLVNFGRLASHLRFDKDVLSRYAERAAFALEYLTLLAEVADLRFSADSSFPFVSNTLHWRDGAPSAGYTGTPADPLPRDVAQTLFANWVAQSEKSYPSGRPLRAALKQLHDDGFDAAIRLLIDLRCAGFITEHGLLEEMVQLLTRARGATGSDRELAEKLVPEIARIRTPREWIDVDVYLGWMRGIAADTWHQPASSELVELALAAVEGLRKARTLDEWVSRSADVRTIVWGVLHVLESPVGTRPALGLRVVLSQLEEISCDAVAFMDSLALRPLADAAGALGVIERSMTMMMEPGMRARLERQRALRPDCLAGAKLDPVTSLPPDWQHVSWRLVSSFAPFFSDEDGQPINLERLAFPVDLADQTIAADWQEVIELVRSTDRKAAIARFAAKLERYPWSSLLRLELGICLDESGEPDRARDVLIEALTISPDDPELWQSLSVVLGNCDAREEAAIAGLIERAARRP